MHYLDRITFVLFHSAKEIREYVVMEELVADFLIGITIISLFMVIL